MSPTLDELLARVVDGWPMDLTAYPLLPVGAHAQEERQHFGLAHAALHLAKNSGKLAALVEPMAHGKPAPDPKEVARQAAYVIIDTLRLLALAGGTVSDVVAAVDAWEKEP